MALAHDEPVTVVPVRILGVEPHDSLVEGHEDVDA